MVNKSPSFVRQVACKLSLNGVIKGELVKGDDDSPNYLFTSDKKKIYRLNLIGIIINKEKVGSITNILLEDGTGKIIVRSFEENKSIETLQIGEIILVIGKVRMFNEEKYISPEIIKKKNPLWLKLRSLELKNNLLEKNIEPAEEELKKEVIKNSIIEENGFEKGDIKTEKIETNNIEKNKLNTKNEVKIKVESTKEENKELNEKIEEEIEEDNLLPFQKINSLILELDTGDGVLIEEIIERSTLEDTENIIKVMLKNGEIFQIQPGKVKVL